MTNFEWLMTLSEEEFTDWVYDQWLHHLQYRWSSSRGGLMKWLKEERAEQTEPHPTCKKCKHYKYRTNCGWECEYDTFEECNYEPKCSEIIEAYSRGYTDGANAVKAMPQTFTADGIVFAKMTEAEQTEPYEYEIKALHKDYQELYVSIDQTEPQICDNCRYYNSDIPCGSTPSACKEADKFAEEFVDGLKKLKPKVEPRTDCAWK